MSTPTGPDGAPGPGAARPGPRREARIPVRRKLAFALALVATPLAALELGLRLLAGPTAGPPAARAPDATFLFRDNVAGLLADPDLYVLHPELFWALRPESERVPSNSLGLRRAGDVEPGSAPGLRVLALGDSTTFGWGLPLELSYPARLEECLRERVDARAEVLNAGVPGYTSWQGRRWFETELAEALAPDLVLTYFGMNDTATALVHPDAELARRRALTRRLESTLGRSHLFRTLAGTVADRRADEGLASDRDRFLFQQFRFLRRTGHRRAEAMSRIEATFGVPRAEVEAAVGRIRAARPDGGGQRPPRVEAAEHAVHLEAIERLAARRGGRTLHLTPLIVIDGAVAAMNQYASASGVDLVPAFPDPAAAAREFLDPAHPGPAGHAAIGRYLCERVRGLVAGSGGAAPGDPS